jgi:hypothetical protein
MSGMPRTGWVKPDTGYHLSDHLSWGLLTRVFPPEVVDRVVVDAGRLQQRRRLLPSRAVVYYVMGLALFSQSSYEEVMRMLMAAQSWSSGQSQTWTVPTKAALFKARSRLGAEPLEALFAQVARPMATTGDAGSFYGPWRLMSVDSGCLDVPDTPANDEAFGRPAERPDGAPSLPQVRVVGLTETGSRSIVAAVLGGVAERTQTLASALLPRLSAGTLLLADRDLFSYASWVRTAATGVDLLWRVRADLVPPVERRHRDGSYASQIRPRAAAGRTPATGIDVRIIELGESADPATKAGVDRLATTIIDPAKGPASDLASLFSQRWEIESAFDELKAHHLSPRVVLRSKAPDGVRQEVYGYLCVHYAIRWLMHGVEGIPSSLQHAGNAQLLERD